MPAPDIKINLISDRKKLLKERKVLVAKLQLFAGVALAVYVAIILVVIVFRTSASTKLKKVEEGIKNETLKITQMNQREAMYTVLENKVSLSRDFLDNRVSLNAEFQKVVDMLPEGASLEQFSMADDNNSITLGIVVDDMYVAVTLLDTFEVVVENEDYDYVLVSGFRRSDNGQYRLSGELPI